MKKILTFLFAAISLSLSAQDCLNLPDTTFVCGFETVLPTTDFTGSWTYLCDESEGTVAMGFDIDGNTEVKINECGEYYFSFSAVSPECTQIDTILIYFDDPSTNSSYGSSYGSLEYDDYGCHNGGSNCADGGGPVTISISGASPPSTDWEFSVTGACSSTNYLAEAINASADGCEADDIVVVIVEAGDLDTVLFTAPEDYVYPQIEFILDSLQAEFADSLADNGCQLINPGCSSICMDNPEMEGDTVVFDTIHTIIPHRIGGNWSLIIGDTCLILEDSTVFAYNDFVNLRLIVAPGADYYGPNSINWSLEQQYTNTAGDTIYGGIQGNYDLIAQWKEFFEYDTITNIVQHTIPDLICNGCGGNFYGYNEAINPEPPVYDCGPIFLSFYYDECFCNPPYLDVFVHNDINCAEPCTEVEFITDAWAPSFSINGPSGFTNTSGFSFSACEPGNYSVDMITSFGCVEYTSFTVIGDFEEFESSFNAEVCEGECYSWNGQDYCSSGSYEQTLIAERNGCDSLVTLNLLVNPLQEEFDFQQVCFGETYNGYPPGTYQEIIQDQCLVLHLIVEELSPSPPQSFTAVVCSGECYTWNGQNYCSSGVYNSIEIDQNGCSYESNLVLIEEPIPTVSLSVSNDIDCENESATLSVPNQMGTYEWSTGETGTSITVEAAGQYSVVFTSENNCSTSVATTVEGTTENTTLEEILYICPGECIMVNGQEICEAGMYTNVVENGACTTTFISEVRQMYAEIFPTIVPSLDCDNNQGTLYLGFNNEWSAFLEFTITYPDGNVVQTTDMPLVNNITQGGTYEFIGYYYSANGSTCETTLELEIEDNSEQIEVSMSGNPEISCLTGYTQAETNELEGYQYLWSGPSITSSNMNQVNPELTEEGVYTLTVSNPDSGCSTESSFTVLPQPEVEVSTAIEEQISCQTGFVLPQTTVYSDYDYVWSGNGISGENMNDINPELSQAGIYSVVVTNPVNGCNGTAEFTVLAQNEISALADSQASCEDSADGQAIVTDVYGGTAPYLYSIDGENWQTETAFTDLEIGDYILQVQDADNCETQISASVASLPGLPEIEVEISEFSICGTEEIIIDASVPQSENLNYLWSNGETGAILTTSTSGDYEVEISNNCASETIAYTVENAVNDPNKFIFVPDAFSPNADSNNESLKGYFGKEVLDYQFRVFDRWGNLVFNSTNPEEGWDGSKKGQKLSTGVYIWQMMVRMEGCEEAVQTVDMSGDVLLFR